MPYIDFDMVHLANKLRAATSTNEPLRELQKDAHGSTGLLRELHGRHAPLLLHRTVASRRLWASRASSSIQPSGKMDVMELELATFQAKSWRAAPPLIIAQPRRLARLTAASLERRLAETHILQARYRERRPQAMRSPPLLQPGHGHRGASHVGGAQGPMQGQMPCYGSAPYSGFISSCVTN